MSLPAKVKSQSKAPGRHRQRAIAEVSRAASGRQTSNRFALQERTEGERRGRSPRPAREKARLATFSFTSEDLRYVEKATYQVIQALETGVSKSHTVRLAMRAFASMSVEELRALLCRISPST